MHLHPTWIDIGIRLLLTTIACGMIGFNRGEHGHPAGLRTTLLVGLAAAVAMIEANLLLTTQVEVRGVLTFDVMRLPLGVLSGIGFIGAGAIVKRGDMATGVTTAATLWFVTIISFCFGGGQLLMGCVGTLLAIGVLWGLKGVDRRMLREHRAALVVEGEEEVSLDRAVRDVVGPHVNRLIRTGTTQQAAPANVEWRGEVRWRGNQTADAPLGPLDELIKRPGVRSVCWTPWDTRSPD